MKPKLLSICFISLFFLACSGNHYHDGIYRATVMNPNNWYDIHYEVLTVNGNEMLDEKYTLDGDTSEKLKYKCVQYPDHIEYTEMGGVTKILSVVDSGNLRLNEYVLFKRFANVGDGYVITKQKSEPLIKRNNNGTFTFLNNKNDSLIENNDITPTEDTDSTISTVEKTENDNILDSNKLSDNQAYKFMFTDDDGYDENYREYDEHKRLIRRFVQDGENKEYHTEVLRQFIYNLDSVSKILVITASYEYTNGIMEDCHACYPTLSIARFRIENGNYVIEQRSENFEGSTGAWGMPPDISFQHNNGMNSIEITSSFTGQGETVITKELYDAETFKRISRESHDDNQ